MIMWNRWLGGLVVGLMLAGAAWAAQNYTYNFPKPLAGWGNAVSFNNLSPGFFQVMYQNKQGVVRIATYGISGASMDNLKDPQLIMVFAFDQAQPAAGWLEYDKRLAAK